MTNEQAIAELQKEHDLIQGEHGLDGSRFAPALLEALAMAIEALKAQDMTLHMNLPEVSAEEVVEILKRNNRIELLPSAQPELIRCKDCKYSEHWYKDKTRCFLWHETGIGVFEDGYCNYAKRRTGVDMRGEQDE